MIKIAPTLSFIKKTGRKTRKLLRGEGKKSSTKYKRASRHSRITSESEEIPPTFLRYSRKAASMSRREAFEAKNPSRSISLGEEVVTRRTSLSTSVFRAMIRLAISQCVV